MDRLLLARYTWLMFFLILVFRVGALGQVNGVHAADGMNAALARNVSGAQSVAKNAGLRFTENRGQVADTRGQVRPDILYTANAGSMHLFLRRDGISYVFTRWMPDSSSRDANDHSLLPIVEHANPLSGHLDLYRMDMQLIGANPSPQVSAGEPAEGYSNYYLAQCRDGITDVASYQRVTYRDIYPHIDLVLYSTDAHLKYDFVVHPGGHVTDIAWRYDGSRGTPAIGSNGAVRAVTALGALEETAPYAYQGASYQSVREGIACGYRSAGDVFGFTVGHHDETKDLVIDPSVLWATYLGGTDMEVLARFAGITADRKGNICAIGATASTNFPVTPGVQQSTNNGGQDLFITKMTTGGIPIWSTYMGGPYNESGKSIACDTAGTFAFIGVASDGFPTGGPVFQLTYAGGTDLIVGRLDSNGRRKWVSYLGGSLTEIPGGIAIDSVGDIVVVGLTASADFPRISPSQSTIGGGEDGIIAKFGSSGLLRWATFYGGSGVDACSSVAIDSNRAIFVTGYTASPNLPMFGTPWQPALGGNGVNAFLVALNSSGRPQWSTYFGGSPATTLGAAIGLDKAGAITIAGCTRDTNLPVTASAFQTKDHGHSIGPVYSLDYEGFAAHFDRNGVRKWATYYGGHTTDTISSLVITGAGDIILAGFSEAADFPVTAGAYQPLQHGGFDATLVQLDSTGRQLWSTYYGGSQDDFGMGVVFSLGSVYMIGGTASTDLPATATGFQPASGGPNDAFIVRFNGFCPIPNPTISVAGTLVLCEGDSVTLTASPGYAGYQWAPKNQTTQKIVVKTSGTYSVTANDGGVCSATSGNVTVRVNKRPIAAIAPSGTIIMCAGDSVRLSALRDELIDYRWSNGDSVGRIWVKDTGTYTVRVIDTNGCSSTSAPVIVKIVPRPVPPVLAGTLDTVWVCPDSTFFLDAGAGFTKYTWYPTRSAGQRQRIDSSGLYYVDVTNTGGCLVRSDSVVVMVYPRVPARVVADGPLAFCAGDSVIVHKPAGAFTRPRWSTGDTTDQIAIRASGVYFVTVLDSNGCRERSDSIRVTVHSLPKPDITGPSSICGGGTSIYSSRSVGTLRYEWSIAGSGSIQGAANTRSITVQWGGTGSGSLTLRLTDTVTRCSTSGTLGVTIGTSLKPVVTPSGTLTLCAGDSIELDAGDGYASYAWSNGAAARTIWIKDNAPYTVTVVDPSGCRGTSDTVRAVVEAHPAPVIAGPATVCLSSGSSYSVASLAGASYVWTVTGGVITGGDGTANITVQWGGGSAGTVDVTVTSAGGCSGSALQVAVQLGTTLKPVVTPSGTLTLCAGDSIALDAGAGYASYAWSSGEASQRIIVKKGGSYAVHVSDGAGCSGTSDTVRVIDRPAPIVTITPGGVLRLNVGDSVELDAGAGYTAYRWRSGSAALGSGKRYMARDSGSYSVTVTDVNGCVGTGSVRIDLNQATAVIALGDVQAVPGAHVELPLRLISSKDLAASGVSSYEARLSYHASLLIPTGATPAGALRGDDRVLTVTGVLPAGMTSGDLAPIEFIAALGDDSVSIVKLESVIWRGTGGGERGVASTVQDGMFHLIGLCTTGGARLIRAGGEEGLKTVVPNPSNGVVRIDYNLVEDGPSRLAIVDLLGREVGVVYAGDRGHGSYAESYDVSGLPSGMYRVVLATATGRMSVVMEVAR